MESAEVTTSEFERYVNSKDNQTFILIHQRQSVFERYVNSKDNQTRSATVCGAARLRDM